VCVGAVAWLSCVCGLAVCHKVHVLTQSIGGTTLGGSCLRVVWGFEICLLLLPFGAFCPSLCGLVSFHWLGLTIILDWSQGTRADRFTLAVLKDNFD
jgi:hypothetical protein